jgi:hypothetical protein
MLIPSTNRSKEDLSGSRRVKQAHRNGHHETKLHVSKRPQFRASNVIAYALALSDQDTTHTVSQTMNMALRQFLPAKYIARAEQLLRNERNNRREQWAISRSEANFPRNLAPDFTHYLMNGQK